MVHINFFHGGTVNINHQVLQFVSIGGQGVIYSFYDASNKRFILKFIQDKEAQYIQRMKYLRNALLNKTSVPNSIKSAIPLGQGRCIAKDFNPTLKDANCPYTIFLYAFIEGKQLDVKLKTINRSYLPTIPNFKARINIAKQFLQYKIFMENCGVFKADETADNLLLTSTNQLRAIDMEGGGIFSRGKTRLANTTKGKPSPIAKPPELEFKNQYTIYTERWISLGLLWWILTSTKTPFVFLKTPTTKNLQTIIQQNRSTKWVPGISSTLENPKFGTVKTEQFIQTVFNRAAPRISQILYQTYILGFHKPTLRSNYQTMLNAINHIQI